MNSAWLLAAAALVPLVSLLMGIALGRKLGQGERDVLGYRLAAAEANALQAAEFARTGQPDRVLDVLRRGARATTWRGLLGDPDDTEADASSGEAEADPAG